MSSLLALSSFMTRTRNENAISPNTAQDVYRNFGKLLCVNSKIRINASVATSDEGEARPSLFLQGFQLFFNLGLLAQSIYQK